MPKNKKAYKKSNEVIGIQEKGNDSPTGKKFVLLFFGLGPILIVGWFLFSKGFFDPL